MKVGCSRDSSTSLQNYYAIAIYRRLFLFRFSILEPLSSFQKASTRVSVQSIFGTLNLVISTFRNPLYILNWSYFWSFFGKTPAFHQFGDFGFFSATFHHLGLQLPCIFFSITISTLVNGKKTSAAAKRINMAPLHRFSTAILRWHL